MVESNAIRELVGALSPDDEKKKSDTYSAVVSHIDEEGTVWVILAGSDKETPTASTSTEVKRGDAVTVSWRNNKLYIGGNYSNPSAGVETVMPSVGYVNQLIDQDVTVNSINAASAYIGDLTSKNITAENIAADHAVVDDLDANFAHITNGVIDNAKIGYADVNDLNAHYASITNGVIDNAKIGHADVNGLNANYAQIDAANVTDLSAQNAWVNKIMVQTGLLAHEGTVFTLDAIQVNAANITAGTIDVNRLIVTVDGEKYLVEIDPTTHQPSYEKLDGGIVEPRTITADKIVAHDITVQEITTENLVGTNGWINLNQGKFFYGDGASYAASTNAISWNGTTLKIKGDIGDSVVFNNYSTTTEMNTAIGDAVDAVEVGGKNLLSDTRDFGTKNTTGIWLADTGVSTLTTNTYNGATIRNYPTTTLSSGYSTIFQYVFPTPNNTLLEHGKSYCLSFWAKGSGKFRTYLYSSTAGSDPSYCHITKYVASDGTGGVASPDGLKTWTLTNEWQRYWIVYTFDTTGNFDNRRLLFRHDYITESPTFAGDFCGIKFEAGNKATDWSPSPQDVQNEIDAKKSIHTLDSAYSFTYADILTYSAEGYGASNSGANWDVASTIGVKAGDTVRIKVVVSDMSNTPVYVVGTVTSIVSGTRLKMISHGLDTTVIDGGNILTNSIGANQIKARSIGASKLLVTDDTNLITVTELDANSLQNEMGTPRIENGYLIKNTATQAEMGLTPKQISSFKQNDEIYYEFRIKAAAEGAIRFGIWGYDANGSYISGSFVGNTITATTSEQFVSGYIKLTSAAWTDTVKKYTIGINDDKTTKSQLYVRTAVARRKSAGELIVDGSITTNKLDANAVTIGKINATDAASMLNSNVEVGGKNYLSSKKVISLWTFASGARTGAYSVSATLTQNTTGTIRLGEVIDTTNVYWTLSYDMTISGSVTIQMDFLDSASSQSTTYSAGTHHIVFTGKPARAITDVYNFADIAATTTASGVTISIFNLKVEKGNKATDWTPSPEDLAATATSYITHIDNNGIRIHPSSTENNSAVINANGMEIFKGGTGASSSVAFYGDTARVGKIAANYGNVRTTATSGSAGIDLYVNTTKVGSLHQQTNYTPEGTASTYNNALCLDAAQYLALRTAGNGSTYFSILESYSDGDYGTEVDINFGKSGDPAQLMMMDGFNENEGGGMTTVDLWGHGGEDDGTDRSAMINVYGGIDTEDYITGVGLGVLNSDGEAIHGVWDHLKDRWLIGTSGGTNASNAGKICSPGINVNTTSGGANVRTLGTNVSGWPDYGIAKYASSSRRYKEDVGDLTDIDLDANRLYDLRVAQFRYKEDYLEYGDSRYHKLVPGLIAEEVEEVYPIAVQYEDEMVEDWEPKFIIPPMLKLIQDQKKKIDELEQRLEALERS